ncbi:MAG: twin-arginine translocase subunit TatC, partial [Candidatus Amulumruptor sp.]
MDVRIAGIAARGKARSAHCIPARHSDVLYRRSCRVYARISVDAPISRPYNLTSAVTNTLSLDSYMDNFLTLILTMGIIFELPLVAWMLGRLHILPRLILTRFRRH